MLESGWPYSEAEAKDCPGPQTILTISPSSTTSPPPLHSRVAHHAWSFCLGCGLLAAFFDCPPDICYLFACSRAFVSFRTQTWRVTCKEFRLIPTLTQTLFRARFRELPVGVDRLFSNGGRPSRRRLQCLRTLYLSLRNMIIKLDTLPLLALIITGQVPSLRNMHLNTFVLDAV